jgi:glycerol-1-phosphate dehydrogenase [NAD(P)+]
MAVYKQISFLPIIFQVGHNKLSNVNEIIASKNLGFYRILLISGQTYSFEIAKSFELFNVTEHVFVESNSLTEVERLSGIARQNKCDLLISVGGGKVLDVVKRISLKLDVNHVSIPTIISNDGLISPISVLTNDKNESQSLPGNMPTGVIIDLDIISDSPKQYLQAAAGDILSNMSATNDWIYAHINNNESINDIAFQLSRMSAHSLIHSSNVDLNSKNFQKMIIQGQVNSGIAMALSGTSRPASGSEHLLSHAIDYKKMSEGTLHGYQVGVLSLFSLYLQDKLKKEHVLYAKTLDLSVNYLGNLLSSPKDFLEIISLSRKMRPGRCTILDNYTDKIIYEKYYKYVDMAMKWIQNKE